MNSLHPFIKYAIAQIIQEHNIHREHPEWIEKLILELQRGLDHFRVNPRSSYAGKKKVMYSYTNKPKGDPKTGVYLAPHVLTSDSQAKNIYNVLKEVIQKLSTEPHKSIDVTMSIAPMAGEYLNFGEKNTGRGKPKISNLTAALCLITATSPYKPSIAYKKIVKKKIERTNTAIIPDLELDQLVDFIGLFKRILRQKTENLLEGFIYKEYDKKGVLKMEKPQRPKIFNGNYPNAPKSSAFGSVGLLAAIGEWAKEADEIESAEKVLNSLKNASIYLISFGNAQVFTYNHHIIDLAREGRLGSIIDSLFYSKLFDRERKKNEIDIDYEKFDFFTSRFLIFFNAASFQDFLSHRAEYPNEVTLLFNKYFTKMANILPEVVASARVLGKWLNYVAYTAAKQEMEAQKGATDYWEKLRKQKAKILVELESSTFSARSGDALIAQAVTRAGRLTGIDAPEEAALFMEQTCTGELELDNAKNLLIAFSRLMNRYEKKEKSPNDDHSLELDGFSDNYENAQE